MYLLLQCEGRRISFGSSFEGLQGKKGMAAETTLSCGSKNKRLLAHISVDQEAELKVLAVSWPSVYLST